jgi:hypothetical protein
MAAMPRELGNSSLLSPFPIINLVFCEKSHAPPFDQVSLETVAKLAGSSSRDAFFDQLGRELSPGWIFRHDRRRSKFSIG